MPLPRYFVPLALAFVVGAVVMRGAEAGPNVAGHPPISKLGPVDFTKQVRPILEESCLECHSADRRKGGLSLSTYSDVLDGGKDGPIVKPGRSLESELFGRVTGDEEPVMPKDKAPLTAQQREVLRAWIDQGARETPTSPVAPPPWEAALALQKPSLPVVTWKQWTDPVDRIVAAYLKQNKVREPKLVTDAVFARRAYLDISGLIPTPQELKAFVADRSATKREVLVSRLLADSDAYAENWMTYWNDLLRNDDGVSYFADAEGAGRTSITNWLLKALKTNLPYNEFVRKLLNPSVAGDPAGFLIGVNWRGEISPAVTPWMQAAQNTSQVFLGINVKCNACHDSFINQWKLKDAFSLASFFSPKPKLQLYRCDLPQDQYAEPAFLFPELNRAPVSDSLADRREAAAAIFTDPRNGRFARTIVNRLWLRLIGYGLVAVPDEMDQRPWSPALLDWLASDLVEHGYDLKHTIAVIMKSKAYQLPVVARKSDAPVPRNYVFRGPEVRRLTAEQFVDAIGVITGEWSRMPAIPRKKTPASEFEDSPAEGSPVREWRANSTALTRAMGRPMRDQVTSTRASVATTVEGLELVNGELLTKRLMAAAKRLLEPRNRTETNGEAISQGQAPEPKAQVANAKQAVNRVFTYALGRTPNRAERRLARQAVQDDQNPNAPSTEGVADLLWSVMMKPEFQLIN